MFETRPHGPAPKIVTPRPDYLLDVLIGGVRWIGNHRNWCAAVCVCLKSPLLAPTSQGHKKAQLIIKSRWLTHTIRHPTTTTHQANEHKWAQMSPWFLEGFLRFKGVLIVKRKHSRNYEFVWRNFTRPRQQTRDPKKKAKEKPKKTRKPSKPNRTVLPIMTQFGASKFMFIP